MAETVDTARAAAEKTLGFRIPDHVAEEVLAHTRRKCALNQKPNSYLPLLYENELTDYYMRQAGILRGVPNQRQRHGCGQGSRIQSPERPEYRTAPVDF